MTKRTLGWVGLVAWVALACHAPASQPAAPVDGAPLPHSVLEADAAHRRGAHWSNGDVRRAYLSLVAQISVDDARRKAAGESAEARARAAYATRRNARLTCRAMMERADEVAALRQRDVEKYGDPDGPSFEQLVEHERQKGLAGDAVYDAIVASAQRTDPTFDRLATGN